MKNKKFLALFLVFVMVLAACTPAGNNDNTETDGKEGAIAEGIKA